MEKSNELFEKYFKMAAGNIKHEGMKCTEEEKELIRLKYFDLISEKEFIQRVLELAKKE